MSYECGYGFDAFDKKMISLYFGAAEEECRENMFALNRWHLRGCSFKSTIRRQFDYSVMFYEGM